MFELETETEKIIQQAQMESETFGSEFIASEHVLLAFSRLHQGVMSEFFASRKVQTEDIVREINAILDCAKAQSINLADISVEETKFASTLATTEGICLSPTVRAALDIASAEAGENRISCNHLLRGLLREDESMFVKVLENLGIEPGDIQSAIRLPG